LSARILVVDNYDSFTWNLVQALEVRGARVEVLRNDAPRLGVEAITGADGIVLSPGPGAPATAGATLVVIRTAAALGVPLLGVCLGHQALAVAFGGRLVRARFPRHGKAVVIRHDGWGLFEGVPASFEAMLYHSLAVDETAWPPELEISARGPAGEVMGLRHRALPLDGVQFHPESIGTPLGGLLLSRFVDRCTKPFHLGVPARPGVAA
jgi:anthranilate synthase component 2